MSIGVHWVRNGKVVTMASPQKNSFDLLRLFAATLVLYSHQHSLLGLSEPDFFGWTTLGGIGVSIFFYLSGLLVWSSWARDPDLWRFFVRRSLRIFPALWVVVFVTVVILGPALSKSALTDYFVSPETWRYVSTALLIIRRGLPGVFADNPFPDAINGSLWTLPVEFLCYVSVAAIGGLTLIKRNWLMGWCLVFAVLTATFGPQWMGARFALHFEMVAFFWWGVMYGYVRSRPVHEYKGWMLLVCSVLIVFWCLGPHGVERTYVLLLAAALVVIAQLTPWGSLLTDRLGDLSYGMYIFAFPVQQFIVEMGRSRDWAFSTHLTLSFFLTSVLAYVSWHVIEKRALRFKPSREVVA